MGSATLASSSVCRTAHKAAADKRNKHMVLRGDHALPRSHQHESSDRGCTALHDLRIPVPGARRPRTESYVINNKSRAEVEMVAKPACGRETLEQWIKVEACPPEHDVTMRIEECLLQICVTPPPWPYLQSSETAPHLASGIWHGAVWYRDPGERFLAVGRSSSLLVSKKPRNKETIGRITGVADAANQTGSLGRVVVVLVFDQIGQKQGPRIQSIQTSSPLGSERTVILPGPRSTFWTAVGSPVIELSSRALPAARRHNPKTPTAIYLRISTTLNVTCFSFSHGMIPNTLTSGMDSMKVVPGAYGYWWVMSVPDGVAPVASNKVQIDSLGHGPYWILNYQHIPRTETQTDVETYMLASATVALASQAEILRTVCTFTNDRTSIVSVPSNTPFPCQLSGSPGALQALNIPTVRSNSAVLMEQQQFVSYHAIPLPAAWHIYERELDR
ncbi:hypothetical protein B0H66DRAFT_592834 [Apodospora peruviana]|uniref:Uncharacterized protein n=1 Tax=Apodospora peruviana TaxID=516989 RepID=A0AAE0I1C5_9PEZI|nr:hypothetical protein B0H66DRAFT_592834 [Apodospora peruviana]